MYADNGTEADVRVFLCQEVLRELNRVFHECLLFYKAISASFLYNSQFYI